MEKIRLFLLLALGFCLLYQPLYADEPLIYDGHVVVFEKGDVVYCRGTALITKWLGHTGIFYGWPYQWHIEPYVDIPYLPPSMEPDPGKHHHLHYTTIEALCYKGYNERTHESYRIRSVRASDIQRFLAWGSEFWGVRRANLSALQRKKIVQTAREQLRARYHLFWGYKNPGSPIGWNDSFRCDGLVEYCYEQVGIDLVPGDTWRSLSPLKQMNSPLFVERTKADPPEISEICLKDEGGEIIELNQQGRYEVQGTINIEFSATDGRAGSGLSIAELWLGEPDDTPYELPGERIYKSDAKYDIDNVYATFFDTTSVEVGEYTLYVRAYDQAGNGSKLSRDILVKEVEEEPPVIF